jgi:subtilisin-like proprotein convertase family protein
MRGKDDEIVNAFIRAVILVVFASSVVSAATITVSSTDVPKVIVDNDPTGLTSTLSGPALVNLTDVNLIFDELLHTSVADLHIELTSPQGKTTVLVKAFTENGILSDLGTPANFIGTVFDDQAATNLRDGTAPYTGSFNINHPSVVANPLATFNGEDAAGTWTLFISDLAEEDVGTLNSWSLQFTGTPAAAVPEPTSLTLLGTAVLGLLGYGRRQQGQKRSSG